MRRIQERREKQAKAIMKTKNNGVIFEEALKYINIKGLKDKNKPKINLVTLFSGIGSPEKALKQLQIPHNNILACEIDPKARKCYLSNHHVENMFEDIRGTLFFEFARVVKECEPKVFIFENVKGMVNHDDGKTYDTVLRVFNQMGYFTKESVLNTKDYGIHQNREIIYCWF